MVVNSNNSAQDAATLQTLLQSSSKQNGAAKSAAATASNSSSTSAPATQAQMQSESLQIFSGLNDVNESSSNLSESDAAQLTQFLASAITSDPATAQAAQGNQVAQSVLNLLSQ